MVNSALYDDLGRALLRLTIGGLTLFHGVSKLGAGGTITWIGGQLSDAGLPSFIAYGVFIGEIIGPLMVIAGVYCRIGAVIVAVNMLFAVALVHTPELFRLNEQGGYALELQAFFTLTAVVVALLGSGRFAVKPD
ncbi:MAG: DoxX family protein [Pseudomonadales bacterium]